MTARLQNVSRRNVLKAGTGLLVAIRFAPMLASEVVQGQPHLSGSDAIRTGVGATFATVGGTYIAGSVLRTGGTLISKGFSAIGGSRGAKQRGSSGGAAASHPKQINYAGMQPRSQSRGKNASGTPPPSPPPSNPSGKKP